MHVAVILKQGCPATFDHESAVSMIKKTAKTLLGKHNYIDMPEPLMVSEDFLYLLQKYYAAFACLGVGRRYKEIDVAPCHSNRMIIDEDTMKIGVAMYTALAYQILGNSDTHYWILTPIYVGLAYLVKLFILQNAFRQVVPLKARLTSYEYV